MLSCNYNIGLERTSRCANINRTELEKVLRHYEGGWAQAPYSPLPAGTDGRLLRL